MDRADDGAADAFQHVGERGLAAEIAAQCDRIDETAGHVAESWRAVCYNRSNTDVRLIRVPIEQDLESGQINDERRRSGISSNGRQFLIRDRRHLKMNSATRV